MRIPDNLKKCVVFIGTKLPEEQMQQMKFIGTAFLVSLPSKVPNASFVYLVTAKHVAVKTSGKECYIRLNLKNGKSTFIEHIQKVPWFFHPDETWPSDVAVYPFLLPPEEIKSFDVEFISIASFFNDEIRLKEGIGEGDQVFTVGLFSRHTGSEKNLPIIRMGTIAMMSEEPVHTSLFGNMEAYLIEARSIKGISGSPVFVLKPRFVAINDLHIPTSLALNCLLGLMHGHWDLEPGESLDVNDENKGNESVNMGIAIVIPAKKILETINCVELVKFRTEQEQKWFAKNSTAPNTGLS